MAKLAFIFVSLAACGAYEVSAACRSGTLQCQPESVTSAIALVQKSRGLLIEGGQTPEEDPFASAEDPLAELDRESLGSALEQEDASRDEILSVVKKLVAENQKLNSRVGELEKLNGRVHQLEQINAAALEAMPREQKQESLAQAKQAEAVDPDAGKSWWEIEWGVHKDVPKSHPASSLQATTSLQVQHGGQLGGHQSEFDELRLENKKLLSRVSQLEQLVLAIPVEKLQKDGALLMQRETDLEQLVLKLTQDLGHGSQPTSAMFGAQDNMMMPPSPYAAGLGGGVMQQNQMLQGRVNQLEALLEHRR